MSQRQVALLVSHIVVALLVGLAFVTGACKTSQNSAEKTVEDYLKSRGIREVAFDLFYVDPQTPDRAYMSVTATHSFLASDGKPQREFLGVLLKREGEGWQVEKLIPYTKDKDQAKIVLDQKKSKD